MIKICVLGENSENLILGFNCEIVDKKEADWIIFYADLFSAAEFQKLNELTGSIPIVVAADVFSYSVLKELQTMEIEIISVSNIDAFFEKKALSDRSIVSEVPSVPEKRFPGPFIMPEKSVLIEEEMPTFIPKKETKTERDIDHNKIIAVFSTAGGVGKTFVSTNIAAYSASSGIKTLILEMDLGYGDNINALHLAETAKELSYPTILTWKEYSEKDILKTEYGLHLLPRPEAGGEESNFGSEDAKELLRWATDMYELVVIDFGVSPYVPYARAALENSGVVLLVAEPSAKCANKLISFLKSVAVPLRIVPRSSLVVNRHEPTSYYKPHELARLLEFQNFITIPEDPISVNAATRRKIPVVLFKGKACESLKNLTRVLNPEGNIPKYEKRKSILGSLFKRDKEVAQ